MEDDPRRLIARLAVAVIVADGRIAPSECDVIPQLDNLGFGTLAHLADEEIERAAREPIDVRATCAALTPLGTEAAATIVAALASVAACDGIVSPRELEVVSSVGALLGLVTEEIEYVLSSAIAAYSATVSPEIAVGQTAPATTAAPPTGPHAAPDAAPATSEPASAADSALQRACRMLGVDTGVDRRRLDAAYLGVIERYNPAKVAGFGPEFAVLAVRKLAAATAAFETILRSLEQAR